MRDILALTKDELEAVIEEIGEKKLHSAAVFTALHKKLVDSFDKIDVNKSLREKLAREFSIKRLEAEQILTSSDKTKKFVFKLADGNRVESVLIPNENGKLCACISSQVGCALKCKFCVTGKNGFIRNLTVSEILGQLYAMLDSQIYSIVFMGMGEPLLNLENVSKAIEIITDHHGVNISSKKITVSTAGIAPKIKELQNVNLAVSLNATDNDTRSMLMPINDKYPMEEVLEACKDHDASREVMVEYILFDGVNDSDDDAFKLVELANKYGFYVNLIVFNEHEFCELKASKRAAQFQSILEDNGVKTLLRHRKGADINAACGLLAHCRRC